MYVVKIFPAGGKRHKLKGPRADVMRLKMIEIVCDVSESEICARINIDCWRNNKY